MPILFPENKEAFISTPWGDTNGLKWIYNPERQRWARYDDLQRATYVQATAPISAETGQFWYDTANELLKLWDGANWVEAGGGGGASVVVSADAPDTPSGGDMWLDTSDDTLKVFDESGWLPINTWNALNGTADYIPLTILPPNGDLATGVLAWDDKEQTASLGLVGGTVLQIGQETLYHVDNNTASQINDGAPVMYNGTVGASGRIRVKPWDGVGPSKLFLGLATGDIPAGESGYVTHFGKVRKVNTTGALYGESWESGDVIYLSDQAGKLTKTMPSAPKVKTTVAVVVYAGATNGEYFVRPTYGSNLGEDELVQLSGLADKHALLYNDANNRFENRAIVSADVLDATTYPEGSKIVKRGGSGDASFGEQITVVGISNTSSLFGSALVFSNDQNTNILNLNLPLTPTANRTINFPDASGTVYLAYERRSDFSGGFLYLGVASTGTAESSSFWTIRRQQFSGTETITTTTATGVAWANRLTVNYT